MSAASSTNVASAGGLRDTLSSRIKPEHLAVAAGVGLIIATWANTAIRTTQPLVFADEAGYLLHARGFAGLGEFYGNSYHPGYGLLVSPAMWAAESIHTAFRGVQVINLALLLATFWLMIRIVRWVVPSARPVVAPVAATVVLIYPSWTGFSALALPECLLLMMATGSYLLALEGFEGERRWALPAGAFVAGLIPVVHPRAAVVPIAWGVVTLVGFGLRRIDLRQVVSIAVAGIVGAVLTLLLLSVSAVASEESTATGTGFLTRLLDLDHALRYPSVVLGHWFYAAAATVGLVPLGWVLFARRSMVSLASMVTVLTASLALLVSAAFMLTGLTDKAIYGRYVEPFVAIFAVVGLAALIADRRRWHLFVMVGSIGIPAAIVRLARDGGDFAGSYNKSNVFTLVPLIDELGSIRLGWIAAVSISVGVLIWLGASKRARAIPGVAILGLVFLSIGWVNSLDYFEHGVQGRVGSSQLSATALEAHDRATGDHLECITLDRRSLSQWHRYNYRVHMYRTRFDEVLSLSPAVAECSPWLLSSRADIAQLVPGARLLELEDHAQVGLWVAPGPVQDLLAASDRLFPADWSGPIPESALAFEVELLAVDIDDEGLVVQLLIHHEGVGSPWPGALGIPQGLSNPVRVAVALVEPTHVGPSHPSDRINIPATVAPGERFTIEARVAWPEPVGRDQDDPVLTVEMVQEGVGWFSETIRVPLGDWL